jgi:hypothetical protein
MHRMFLVGILVIVAVMGNVNAQAVPNRDTALALNAYGPLGESPKECSGSWSGLTPTSCEFTCSPGDYLYVWGSTRGDRFGGYPVDVTVSASCGDVNVQCTCLRRRILFTPPCTCEATSEDAVLDEEASGSCTARRAASAALGSGEYYCSSFAPEEAAEWEASGEGWVIQIPERN